MIVTLDINIETGKAKVLDIIFDDDNIPSLTVEPNKVRLNKSAIKLFNEGRVHIGYEKSGDTFIPIIGNASLFGTEGTKISKIGTVIYKGANNEVLREYGTLLYLKPYKEGIYKLVADNTEEEDSKEEIEDLSIDESFSEEDYNIDFDHLKFD